MKFLTYLLSLSFLVLTGCQSTQTANTEFKHIFNGKDFTGWRATFNPGSFKIKDGILVVNSTGNGPNLLYMGDDLNKKYKDFELVVEAKAEPNSNSGIYFHTDGTSRTYKGWLHNGYEAQLNSTEKEKRKTGSLYGIQDVAKSPVDETEWFTLRIKVKGKRIQVWVNDTQTADYTEPNNVERPKNRIGRLLSDDGGYIGIQAHDLKSKWYFKTVKIREI